MDTAEDRPRIRAWMMGTGILLVLIGFAFLVVPLLATALAGIAAGALLLVSGVAQVIDAMGDKARGRGLAILLGVVAAVAGVMLLIDPVAGMVGFTVLLAVYLLVSGAFRIVLSSAWSPVPGWGWMLFNGVVSVVLGLMILAGWPGTGLWTVGVFLGVDSLLAGFSRISRSLSTFWTVDRSVPTRR